MTVDCQFVEGYDDETIRRNAEAWERCREEQFAKASGAVQRGDVRGSVRDASKLLSMYDSETCLGVMLDLLDDAPSKVFWPVFLKLWSGCDNTWDYRDAALHQLRQHAPMQLEALDKRSQRFHQSLEDEVVLWRGCSGDRILGLSWTMDAAVATRFAQGHRGITVPDSVIVSARYPKAEILSVFTDRKEAEIIVDPRKLRDLTLHHDHLALLVGKPGEAK